MNIMWLVCNSNTFAQAFDSFNRVLFAYQQLWLLLQNLAVALYRKVARTFEMVWFTMSNNIAQRTFK